MAGAGGIDVNVEIEKALAEGKGWSDEERQAYLDQIPDNHPLFTEKLEDMDPDVVEAFKNMAYEGQTEETMAEHCKEEGNKRFQRGPQNRMYYKHAVQFYAEGLRHAAAAVTEAAKGATKEQQDADGDKGSGSKDPELIDLRATLYANRAAASLGLKNYGSAIADCNESLKLKPGNVKCLYRKAKAQQCLRKYTEARESCQAALLLDPSNKPVLGVQAKVDAELDKMESRRRQQEQAKQQEYDAIGHVWSLCHAGNITIGRSAFEEEGHHMKHNECLPYEHEGVDGLVWPVMLLYPEFGQSDLIQAFCETDLVAEHLARAFPEEGPPLPWDEGFHYRCTNLVVYLECTGGTGSAPSRPIQDSAECVLEYQRLQRLKQGGGGGGGGGGGRGGRGDEESKAGGGGTTEPAPSQWWLVPPKCTLGQLLRQKGHVVAWFLPTLTVFPADSQAHEEFRRKHRPKVITG